MWHDIALVGSFLACLVGLIALQRVRGGVEPLRTLIDWFAVPGVVALVGAVVIAIGHGSGTWATIQDVCAVVWRLSAGAFIAGQLSSWWFERRRRRA
jgi:hypothetical protein